MSNSLRRYTPYIPLAATVALVFAVIRWRHVEAPPHSAPIQAAAFVGSAACAPCHQTEYDAQSHSRHAVTLRLASRKDLGALSPPVGAIPGTGFVLQEKDEHFVIAAPDQSDYVAPIGYALGSGKTGMTYVSPVDNNRLAEMRMSYFPDQKSWYITPGQETLAADTLGKIHPAEDGQKCMLCHAVTLPRDSLEPERRFWGVGCESCHGPGSAHIAAMRDGAGSGTQMESLSNWPATRLNELCGRCHGTTQDVEAAHLPEDTSNRFQTYGLMRSQCFKQSHDTLSCLSCHDPHTNVSTDVRAYESVCLTCHSLSASAHRSPRPGLTTLKQCPVNPRSGCIGCHMPSRQAIPNTRLPTSMADHFIRVQPKIR